MNFATFSAVGTAGTHFVTTGGQLPVTKIQQNVSNNGATISQVVGMAGGVNMGDGMQYIRSLDGGATLQTTPQLITVPITLPGTKPGDPQPTVQIQVLSPNILQQQQPKYMQMQIPIQGFPQSTTMVTFAYSPDTNDGVQLLGNTLPEGLQLLTTMPQEMQLAQQDSKEQIQQAIQHQVFITPNQQIIINGPDSTKILNNNTSTNNQNPNITDMINSQNPSFTEVIVKQECDDNDDESSQGTETNENLPWQLGNSQQDLVKILNQLPSQQTQQLPVSLQQFLRLNSTEVKKSQPMEVEIEIDVNKTETTANHVESEEDKTGQNKKKKKYKKKPPKPARPKPGQVRITVTEDGKSMLWCCPECQMAFPEKEELEVHLSVHKIERRFICGLCGAGLKRKEHLERHKLGHNPERPYVCGVCGKGFKRREHLNLHTVIHSGVKTELCGECGKGFYRKDHLRKHTRSHESKRARDEASAEPSQPSTPLSVPQPVPLSPPQPAPLIASLAAVPRPAPLPPPVPTHTPNTVLPEITIHVPSSGAQAPVQINIPQHVVSSLAAAQQQRRAPAPLDALLPHHQHS